MASRRSSRSCASTTGCGLLYEPNESNPYRKDFYSDMRAHAFKSQMWFLAQKFRMHQSLEALDEAVIQDRTVWEDAEIFAAGLKHSRFIRSRDWALYRGVL